MQTVAFRAQKTSSAPTINRQFKKRGKVWTARIATFGTETVSCTVSPAVLRAYAYGGLTDWTICRRAIDPFASRWCWPLSTSDQAAWVLGLDLNFFCQLIRLWRDECAKQRDQASCSAYTINSTQQAAENVS
jgi:hypothetical protein